MINDKGTIIRIKAKDVSVLGRNTQGVTLMRTNDGGKVVSIEKVQDETDEDKAEENKDQTDISKLVEVAMEEKAKEEAEVASEENPATEETTETPNNE
jgi:DNA gyrase subunit A